MKIGNQRGVCDAGVSVSTSALRIHVRSRTPKNLTYTWHAG
jgi:hypothetical protein